MRLSGTSATNWLNDIKQYGRQFNDILEIYNDGSGEYISSQAIGTFLQSDINRIEYSVDCNLLKTEMGKLVVDINKSSQLYSALTEGRYLRYKIEIVGNNTPVDYGYFLITKIEEQKDKKSVLVTCYDGLVKTMTDYKGFYDLTTDTTFIDDKNYYLYDVSDDKYVRYKGDRTGSPSSLNLFQMPFPIRIADYVYRIAQKFNMSVIAGGSANVNNYVTSEHYVDIDGNSLGYTYRDVLDQLAEAGGCRVEFYVNNNYRKYIVLRNVIHETSTTIDENYFDDKNVNIGKKVGPYNCLVLSRANDSDNIYYPAILPQDPCEFKISNNLILEQDNREDFLQALYNIINGLEFYENDFSTKGICLFEAGDRYVANIDNTNYTCLMLHDQMVRTTGLKEKTQTTEPKFSVTDFKYASNTDRAELNSRNAMIKVDKANASIEQIVEAIGENGEVTSASIVQSINDSGSQIKLNADKIYINGVTFDNDQNMTITEGTINIQQSAGDNSIYTYEDDSMTNTRTETGLYPAGVSSDIRDLSNNNMDIWSNYYSIEARLYDHGNNAILTATDLTFSDSNNNTKFYVDGTTGNTTIGGNLVVNNKTNLSNMDNASYYITTTTQMTGVVAWASTQIPFNNNGTFKTSDSNLFEKNGNYIKCKFTGSVLVIRQLTMDYKGEVDIIDEWGWLTAIETHQNYSFTIINVNANDNINFNFSGGMSGTIYLYQVRLNVIRLS